MRWRQLILASVLLAVIGVSGAAFRLEQILNAPMVITEGSGFLVVEPGDNLRRILREAERRGWLQYPRLVEWWARHRNLDQGLHVGEYQVPAGIAPVAFLQMLNEGNVVRYSVTLPEGITLAIALDRLHADPILERVLDGASDDRLLALTAPAPSAEGWFLPETYQFTRGDSDLDILTRAHRAMVAELDAAWASRHHDVPLSNPYEALILASIVERETSVPEERPAIAGVFTRRLQQDMRLQTDPTIIYGLGDAYEGNLTRAHLRDKSNPWNTYVIKGLPPTPISLPGVAALQAAVQPAAGDALYFVARGDGYHAFAATLEEHNANVKRFQLSRRGDYRSTPDARP